MKKQKESRRKTGERRAVRMAYMQTIFEAPERVD